jgi:hypothetical protein
MNTKTVIQLNNDSYYVGTTEADESPLEPGIYLMPAGAIEADVPEIPEGKRAKRVNDTWIYEDLPEDITTIRPLTFEQRTELVRLQRQGAYVREADPLFFKWQREEITKDEWLNKILEIKERFPNPTE